MRRPRSMSHESSHSRSTLGCFLRPAPPRPAWSCSIRVSNTAHHIGADPAQAAATGPMSRSRNWNRAGVPGEPRPRCWKMHASVRKKSAPMRSSFSKRERLSAADRHVRAMAGVSAVVPRPLVRLFFYTGTTRPGAIRRHFCSARKRTRCRAATRIRSVRSRSSSSETVRRGRSSDQGCRSKSDVKVGRK